MARRTKTTPLREAAASSFSFILLLFAIEAIDSILGSGVGHSGIEAIDSLLGGGLDRFGIVPRTLTGLLGIAFSPLLHGNFQHLIANSIPLFILLTLLLANARYRPEPTLAMIWLASGFGTWLIGRGGSFHIGASSLVYGLAAYLITAGFLVKHWTSVLTAVFVAVFYGGIFIGVLPRDGPVSWEGHLAGAAAGIWAARKNHLSSRSGPK